MRLQLNGFSAWITIDAVEQTNHLIEYSPDGSLVTCWIVSEVGKNFSVHWQDLQRTFMSSGKVFIDGMSGHVKILTPSASSDTLVVDGFRTSRETKRLFLFSELELTDDDQYLHTAATNLGTIKLDIWRCEIVNVERSPNRVYTYTEPEKIHERSKKVLGHRCKLGPDVHSFQKRVCYTKNLCKIVTFEFKYRPLSHLQANGIVPLSQNPNRARESKEIIDLSQDNEDDEALEAQRVRTSKAELRMLEGRQSARHKHVKAEPQAHVKVEAKDNFINLT